VQLDDISMYFEVSGTGKPLVLLHGGLDSAKAWSRQIPVFARQYRVITPDSRGQGRSTDGDAPISYHQMAEDTLSLLDHLGIETATIIGWSDGANTALDLAIHHPERVAALVVYGAHTSPQALQESALADLQNTSIEELQRGLRSDYVAMSPDPQRLPAILEEIKTMWLTLPAFTRDELAGIRVPTLVLDGEDEEVVRPEHAAEIAAAIPDAQLVILPGVGHFAPAEKADAWNAAVLDFLRQH